MGDIEIHFRSAYTLHGEELVHALDGEFSPNRHLIWPDPSDDACGRRSRGPIVATINGVVGARAFFESELYPFAELLNLYVAPEHRGRGVGSSIVADAVLRASELGYLAVHVQTDLDNKAAQRLYVRHGFVPAQQGEMLRMIRFINLPLLSTFLAAHPLVTFDSKADSSSERLWTLEWRSLISADSLTLVLSGGSCQADSDGFAPGVVAAELRSAGKAFKVSIDGASEAAINSEIPLTLQISNTSNDHLEGVVRLLLNSGFVSGSSAQKPLQFEVAPGCISNVNLSAKASDSFGTDFWKYSSYGSVAIGAESVMGPHSFWLARQMKVTST